MQQKLGYSSKLPTEIRYRPEEIGGLGLFDLCTALGISTLKYMRDGMYSQAEAGKLMILNAKYSALLSQERCHSWVPIESLKKFLLKVNYIKSWKNKTLNVKYLQIESGISKPLLEHPGISISYLTPTWITSVRQCLPQHNLSISPAETIMIKFRGPNDRCIMNRDTLSRYTARQQWGKKPRSHVSPDQ